MSLASIPISILAMMIMYSVGMKQMGPYYMASGKMNNTIIEYVNGMEVVKVFNKQQSLMNAFLKTSAVTEIMHSLGTRRHGHGWRYIVPYFHARLF